MEHDSKDEDVPLHLKRPFGAGLKLQRVEFVRASSPDGSASAEAQGKKKPAELVADAYLSIVMPNGREEAHLSAKATTHEPSDKAPVCPVCSLPLASTLGDNDDDDDDDDDDATGARQLYSTCPSSNKVKTHEASIAHQVCLEHSHPPSHLDRRRMGLAHLQSFGWDPDARLGLGPPGQEGIHMPIKTREKSDVLGVGAAAPDRNKAEARRRAILEERGKKGKTMGRRQRKEKERRERVHHEILKSNLYGDVDVDKYLGRGKPAWE